MVRWKSPTDAKFMLYVRQIDLKHSNAEEMTLICFQYCTCDDIEKSEILLKFSWVNHGGM